MGRTEPRSGQPPIRPDRVRSIRGGGFAFLPNRFLHDGFFAALPGDEFVLYVLLVLAGDRNGLSFYHYDSLCSLAGMPLERPACRVGITPTENRRLGTAHYRTWTGAFFLLPPSRVPPHRLCQPRLLRHGESLTCPGLIVVHASTRRASGVLPVP